MTSYIHVVLLSIFSWGILIVDCSSIVVHYCADTACGIIYTFPVIKISSSCFGLSLSVVRPLTSARKYENPLPNVG